MHILKMSLMGHNRIRSSSSWLRMVTTLIFASSSLRVHAQVQSTAPFVYPGIPTTPYGPDWQYYYEVKDPLPNVTWSMPRSFAGSVSVNRENHPNNTLFFYAFEREDGSLSAADGERTGEPWFIWLNGGPGSSSMYGAFQEIGPIRIGFNNQPSENPWSWHQLADIFFVDQPVGTGFSTADAEGFVANEEQVGQDFANFLTNIVAIFPSLNSRPLYLAGESYAGTYIPYISKTLFSMANPPVKPVKIAIGDGAIGTVATNEQFGVMAILDTFPQLINFDPRVYDYFAEQFTLCGFNLTFSYPETRGHFPPFEFKGNGNGKLHVKQVSNKLKELVSLLTDTERKGYDHPKPALERRLGEIYPVPTLTGKINRWYGCWLVEEVLDFAHNYTIPWQRGIDIYDISDALAPEAPDDPAGYLNNPMVKAALHAPNRTFVLSFRYPFGWGLQQGDESFNDPSPEPMTFFGDLAKNVTIVLYSGNNDPLLSHRGTELAIQNTTFGGIQGFTKRPNTPFTDDKGNFAGIIHQERNITYALFAGASHMVPVKRPEAAYAFSREFILGSNSTGLVRLNGTVTGGEDPAFFSGIIQGTEAYEGSYSTTATRTWPASAWSAWDAFVATRTNAVEAVTNNTRSGNGNGNPGSAIPACPSATTLTTWTLALLFGSFML